jgi:hypothetical protein
MALVTISVHGHIQNPAGPTNATGTVTFRILHELRDTVANVIYAPHDYVATLVAGAFTIVLPTTDNPDISPLNWVYQVWVDTNVWDELFYVRLPVAAGPVAELADLARLDYDLCTGEVTAQAVTLIID